MHPWRMCQVPGDNVVEAYCALAEAAETAEAEHGWASIEARTANAKCEGFRQAVEIYCPSVPGYTCTGGSLIMAADAHMMALEAARTQQPSTPQQPGQEEA